jgi:integrase
MTRAKRLSGSLRGETYYTLIGLLACTGIRISEALHLRPGDVDLVEGVLTIRESKFRKTRLVPLHATVIRPLRDYARERKRLCPLATTFFASERGGSLAYRTVSDTFSHLRHGIGTGARRPPRLHDLRHTFTCSVLLRWQKSPKGALSRVAILSRYLGHARVTDTYWYLNALPELMAFAAKAFAHYQDEN